MKLDRLAFCVMALAWTAGCGGGGDDPDNGWTCVGGCATEGVTAVDNDTRAKRLANAIAEAAIEGIPDGTFSGKVVQGLSGSATFTGTSSFAQTSCGTDCSHRANNKNVQAVFSSYRVKVGTDEVTLTGTAVITDNEWSQQSGLNYSSGGAYRVQSPKLIARHAMTDSRGNVWGEADTVAIDVVASGDWAGSLLATNGVTYSF